MPDQTIQDLADRYGDAWHSHDPDAIVALHTDDTKFHLHVGDEPARGRDAVRETFAQILTQWPDLHFHPVALRYGDDFWVAEWRMTATGADGSRMEADAVDVITVENGLVKTKDTYVDSDHDPAADRRRAGGGRMTVTEPRAQERSQAAEFVDFFAKGWRQGSERRFLRPLRVAHPSRRADDPAARTRGARHRNVPAAVRAAVPGDPGPAR